MFVSHLWFSRRGLEQSLPLQFCFIYCTFIFIFLDYHYISYFQDIWRKCLCEMEKENVWCSSHASSPIKQSFILNMLVRSHLAYCSFIMIWSLSPDFYFHYCSIVLKLSVNLIAIYNHLCYLLGFFLVCFPGTHTGPVYAFHTFCFLL